MDIKQLNEEMNKVLNEISDELANASLEKVVHNTLDNDFSDESLEKENKMMYQLILRKKRQGKELSPEEIEFLDKVESKLAAGEKLNFVTKGKE